MGEISTVTLLDGVTYDIKDAKSRMVILKYGSSTWDEFITAYDNKAIVYCRASSGSNPGTGSQTRLAFMAYVNNETTPTEVEFQYYRSVSSHSDSQQGDQVYVYKLNKTTGWSVTTRNAFTKVIAGNGLTSSYANGAITLNTASTQSATPVIFHLSTSGYFENATHTSHWTLSVENLDNTALSYTDAKSRLDSGAPAYLRFTYLRKDTDELYDWEQMFLMTILTDGSLRPVAPDTYQVLLAPEYSDGYEAYTWIKITWNSSEYTLSAFIVYGPEYPNSDLIVPELIPYDNTDSGLAATRIKSAIDELARYNGTVLRVSTGTGLTGGPITTAGTISHADYGSAGTAGTSSATSGKTLAVPYITTNAQGHVTAKGTHTHTVTGFAAPTESIFKSTSSEVYVEDSTSTFTAIDNISAYDGLTTGYWLVQATVNFNADAKGYRVAVISQSNSISSANNWGTVIVGASPYDVTRVQVMALMKVTSTTTPIHVFVKQNSGSTRKVVATLRAFRLG